MSRLRALVIAGLTLLALATLVMSTFMDAETIGFSIPAFLLVVVGGFLLIRVPHNLVGTVLVLGGAAWLLYTATGEYARLSLRSGPFPGEYLAAWLGSWIGAFLPASLAALLLVFPDGRPPRRWRWLGGVLILVGGLGMAGAILLWGLAPTVLTDFDSLDLESAYLWVDLAFIGGYVSVVPASLSLVSRYRRGDLVERQQIKWLLAAACLFAGVFVGGIVLDADTQPVWGWLLSGAMALLPIAVAFAVARYRLYDIDRIISRAVSYVLVVGVLGLIVFGLITGLAVFLPSDDPVVVAVATLVVFALFNPLRLRVQRVVDRRFNRSRYDAEQVVEGLAYSLQERVDPDRVVDGWIGTVIQTMEPAGIAVWIRE